MGYNMYISALLMATACCTTFIAYLSWKRREYPIAISLSLGMLAGSFYSLGYAFEIVSTSLEQIRFWLRFEYIGISFGTFIWFTMVLQYTHREAWSRKWMMGLLAIVPILTFISHYTNQWHYLYYKNIEINQSEGFTMVSLVAGPFYKLHVAYSYMLFLIGMVLLFQMYRNASVHVKKQTIFMMIGSCAPYLITLIYLSGILGTTVDISPFGFLISGIFYMWGIYQFNLMKLAPLALQKVFESMKDAVVVFDLDLMIISYNQAAKRIIKGLNDKKVIGQPAANIFSSYPELHKRIVREPSIENKIRISDQEQDNLIHYYHVHVSYVRDSSQKTIGKMLLLSDVTEEVRAEEILHKNAKQLSDLNLFKDKMFTVIAHDIRDPLAVLISLMELLRDEIQGCDKSHDELVHEMGQQIDNTFTLVESLLDWFRSQRGGMRFNPVLWNISQVVQNNVRLLQVQSSRKNIRILSGIPSDTFVYADKEMLDLIIRNLLSNAIKFTGFGGNIQIEAAQAEGQVIISVRDTGEGMSRDQAESLLQEDHPISSLGTSGERGVGLGLTLCREFVKMNGGDIWLESAPGEGSTFYVSIPTPDRQSSGQLFGQARRSHIE